MVQLGATSNLGQLNTNTGQPDILGTGMYQAPDFQINGGAFNNPVNSSNQFSNQLGSYLPSTTHGITAATAAAPTAQANQLQLANTYGQIASGQGPNPALEAARQQGAANIAGAESVLGSARGAGNPAAAQLAARNAQAQGAQQIAQAAVPAEAQQQLNALGAQAGLYGQVAGQQQGLNQFNAGQTNTIAQGNQGTNLAANTNLLGTLSAQDLAQLNANMSGQQLGVQQQLGLGNIGLQAYQNAAAGNRALAGSIMQGAGGLASAFL